MQDYDGLRKRLPATSRLIIGDVAKTVPSFLSTLRQECPIGYVVVDVDYYSSAVECLKIFSDRPYFYLPETLVYLDDVTYFKHNPWQGEYLALNEFNGQHEMRKACSYNFLRAFRLFKNAPWLDQVFLMHILDHECKKYSQDRVPVVQGNPYLGIPTVG